MSLQMLIMDRSQIPLQGDALFPFALEDLLCREVGRTGMPVLHMWRHERAFIMGLRDRKLPQAERAITWLREQGYATIVRHSGGAAVPLDAGVLNVSLILPKASGETNFHQDFERMVHLLREALVPFGITFEVGEVSGSYCPGDYDLSINGRKFCGIAQRRQLRAFVIQAFLVVEGEGKVKGYVAQQFYEKAAGNDENSEHDTRQLYHEGRHSSDALRINPCVMASLSEMTASPLSIAEVATAVIRSFSADANVVRVNSDDDWPQAFGSDSSSYHWTTAALELADQLRQRYDKRL